MVIADSLRFFLPTSDLMASFAIALSQSWLFAVSEYSWATCLTLRSFIEFSVVASFFWSSCIAFYLFYAIVWHKDMMLSEVWDAFTPLTRFPHSPPFSFSHHLFFLPQGSKGTSAGKKWNWTNVFMIVAHIVCWGTPLGTHPLFYTLCTRIPAITVDFAPAQCFVLFCWPRTGTRRPRADGTIPSPVVMHDRHSANYLRLRRPAGVTPRSPTYSSSGSFP